jgi:hypothetical protein
MATFSRNPSKTGVAQPIWLGGEVLPVKAFGNSRLPPSLDSHCPQRDVPDPHQDKIPRWYSKRRPNQRDATSSSYPPYTLVQPRTAFLIGQPQISRIIPTALLERGRFIEERCRDSGRVHRDLKRRDFNMQLVITAMNAYIPCSERGHAKSRFNRRLPTAAPNDAKPPRATVHPLRGLHNRPSPRNHPEPRVS